MLTGNISALVTPFTKDLLVDEKAFASLLARQIDSGIDGVLLFGSTGEGVFLSKTQKIALLKIAKTIIQDRIKLIVSVSNNNTMTAIILININRRFEPRVIKSRNGNTKFRMRFA